MLLTLSPILVGLGLTGTVLVVLVVALVFVGERRHARPHDPEQAIADLTAKLRQNPVKYRLQKWMR